MLKERYPNLKLLIALGGADGSQHFSDMAATPASRRAFVRSCIDLYIKGNLPRDLDAGGPGAAAGVFDGFDVDWEFPGACGATCEFRPEDGENLTALLQEFRRQLNAIGNQRGKTCQLTIDIPPTQELMANFQLDKIHKVVDHIDVMAFNFHGTWEDVTNFNAPLYPSPRDPARASKLTTSEAVQRFSVVQSGWIYSPVAREFWTFDDGQSMAAKAAYVKSKQLGGVAFFELSADTKNGELVEALVRALQ